MSIRNRLAAIILGGFVVACYAGGVSSEEAAAAIAGAAIDRYKLSTLSDDCVSLRAVEHHTRFDVDVHERHTPACGGDAETAPRLFTIRVRKIDGALTSDVYDHVDFKPLDHALN